MFNDDENESKVDMGLGSLEKIQGRWIEWWRVIVWSFVGKMLVLNEPFIREKMMFCLDHAIKSCIRIISWKLIRDIYQICY